MNQVKETVRFVYGPVRSWRTGTSLGIDPIGEVSTCSFNCSYCQLGKIQNHISEIKTYVPTEQIISDLEFLYKQGQFDYKDLDVITFAGSGEPTLAENLGELINEIRKLQTKYEVKVPISILTNATTLNDAKVRARVVQADLVSLKLDAANDEVLQMVNQPVSGIQLETIVGGIKKLSQEIIEMDPKPDLQLQIMFMPKFINDKKYLQELTDLIKELDINKIQINTPTRPRPLSTNGEYWLDTRGNHYSQEESSKQTPDYIELRELPAITEEQATNIELFLRSNLQMQDLQIINVYKAGPLTG